MIKIDNINVKELNSEELLSVDGGMAKWLSKTLAFLVGVGIGLIVGAATE